MKAFVKRLPFLLFALSAVFLLSTLLIAQETSERIALIDSQTAIRAHPAGQASAALEEQAQDEIAALQADLNSLVQKANSGEPLSQDEQARFQTLRSTLTSVQQSYAERIGDAVAPALTAVDEVIQAVAGENGYTLVLDRSVAGPEGINLIVYAQEGLDITEQVVERVRTLQ